MRLETATGEEAVARPRSSGPMHPTPKRWCRSSRNNTRSSVGTNRAGAGAARSSSCAMAPPDGPSAELPRDFTSELGALRERLAEAGRDLGRAKLEVGRVGL